jgi:hypothetical protein
VQLTHGRQFVGSFDDILDIGYVSRRHTTQAEAEDNVASSSSSSSSFLLAIVSNSPHVRILDDQFNCHATYYGHTDIVLAVDVCPTG